METRGAKAKNETELRVQLQTALDRAGFAKRQFAELSTGTSRVERDAVIVVAKSRRDAAKVRLGYLVGAANWWPQYRLRGGVAANRSAFERGQLSCAVAESVYASTHPLEQ